MDKMEVYNVPEKPRRIEDIPRGEKFGADRLAELVKIKSRELDCLYSISKDLGNPVCDTWRVKGVNIEKGSRRFHGRQRSLNSFQTIRWFMVKGRS